MRFKLFGTEIYISFLFCALLCLMICVDRTGLVIPTLISVAVHEAGHLFVMYITESAPLSVKLIPASVQITRRAFESDKSAVSSLIAGPAANLCVALCAGLNFYIYEKTGALNLAVINAALGLFNLLPVCGFDGGDLLLILLSKKHNPQKCVFILRIITAITALFTLAAAIIISVKSGLNLSVFTVALYFTVCAAMGK